MKNRQRDNASLSDTTWWAKQGKAMGWINQPATAAEVTPLDTQLAQLLAAAAAEERAATTLAVTRVDTERASTIGLLDAAQRSTDAYERSNIPTHIANLASLDASRAALHADLVAKLHRLEQQAAACDAAWKVADQTHRNRRLVLPPKPPTLPDHLYAAIADPYQN